MRVQKTEQRTSKDTEQLLCREQFSKLRLLATAQKWSVGFLVWLVFNNPYRICLTNHAFETYAKKRYQRNVLKIINLTTKHFLYRNIFKWLKYLDSYLKQYNFHLLPLISNSWCTWMVFLRVFPLHLHQAQQFSLSDRKPTVLRHDPRGAWQNPQVS